MTPVDMRLLNTCSDCMHERSNDTKVYCAAACVAISTQIEAAVKACEEETSKLGQDYYTALAANSPGSAAKSPPSASTGPALAKNKAGKGTSAAAAEVHSPMTVAASCGKLRHVQYRIPSTVECSVRHPYVSQAYAQS